MDNPNSFEIQREPLIFVISGPSGVGKDALLDEFKKNDAFGLDLQYVVTMTSRQKRENEQEAVDYFFVSRERFEEMIAADAFVEYAMVYNDYKGIPKSQLQAPAANGADVILRINVDGAATIKRLFPRNTVTIFLIPETQAVLQQRLVGRKTESAEALRVRLETARAEFQRLNEFDYLVYNRQDQLAETVQNICAIVQAERLRVRI